MKTITIKGDFESRVTNSLTLNVYSVDPSAPFDISEDYTADFVKVIQLKDSADYNIDLTGFTPGKFEVEISGEFTSEPNPIKEQSEKEDFQFGYVIRT